jgi:hypothetical protein
VKSIKPGCHQGALPLSFLFFIYCATTSNCEAVFEKCQITPTNLQILYKFTNWKGLFYKHL